MYVPRAMYSFRMSFWIVPRSCFRRPRPAACATAMYIASSTAAGALIVMLVLTLSSGIRSNSSLHVVAATRCSRRPCPLRLGAIGIVGVVADLRRQIERDRQARSAPARAGSDSAGSIPPRWHSPRTGASSRSGRDTSWAARRACREIRRAGPHPDRDRRRHRSACSTASVRYRTTWQSEVYAVLLFWVFLQT